MALVRFLLILFLGLRSSGSEEFETQVSPLPQIVHIHKSEDTSCKDTAKRIGDQLSRLETLASDIHHGILDLKLGQNTTRDAIQNTHQEITTSKGINHQIYMHEVSFPNSGGIAKASSTHEQSAPMNAFRSSSFWHSETPYTVPQSLWFEFPEPIRVVKYSFTSRLDQNYLYTATDGPSKYIFWASNQDDCSEESLWVILYEDNSGTPFKKSNEAKMEYINNSHFYRCYGFKVIDVPGRSIKPVTIGNVRFYSILAKHIGDELSRLETLVSNIHHDIRDLKLDQNTTRDAIQNYHEEITTSKGINHQIYMHEVSFPNSGGIAKASSTHGESEPMNAFRSSGFWHSETPYTVPQSLWFEFPEPIRVVRYSFTSRLDQNYLYTATDGPSKYIFWASNHDDCSEESLWVILHEDNSGTPFKKSNEVKMKYINNNHLYRCYGFKVTDVPGRSIKPVTIGNVRFYSILGEISDPHQSQLSFVEKMSENVNNILMDTQDMLQTLNDSLSKLTSATKTFTSDNASDISGMLLTPKLSPDNKLTWYESWMRCQEMGAEPFIPKTKSDFYILKTVRYALNDYFWVPASDLAIESHLRWYTGEDASNTPGLEWTEGTHQALNKEDRDCVIFGSRQDGVFMWGCNTKQYPMICKKNA